MDITKKIESLLTEKEEKIKIEIEAHKRIIEIDRQVKSLKRLLKEASDILDPGFEVEVEENGQGELTGV